MFDKIMIWLQYIVPQRTLSYLMGCLAESKFTWLKNKLISSFISQYKVNMAEAVEENPFAYLSFNDFFIRHIKPNLRPIAQGENTIISPVDGSVTEFGHIENGRLLQAKNHYYGLVDLLGGSQEEAQFFHQGHFATFYLAPHDYHRVHMPIDGRLLKTIYVPGRLFSVNNKTAQYVSNLYTRNERLIIIFDTAAGRMAVILVGAMIVGNIQTTWPTSPSTDPIYLKKGQELGYFKLGSTVLIIFEQNKVNFENKLEKTQLIKMGELIGQIILAKG
jgi:phosphatidylserine decarboxylase